MIAARGRRALVAVLPLVAAVALLAAPVDAKKSGGKNDVEPFCAGVTNTWVEACVGSLYDTVAAVVNMVGMGMPI